MKILNIDSFVQPKRTLTLGGKDYAVKDLDVQQFLDNLAAAEALEATVGGGSLSSHVGLSLTAISQAIPDIDMALVRKLPVDAMTQILKFIRGDLDNVVAATPEGTDAAKKST